MSAEDPARRISWWTERRARVVKYSGRRLM